jgi:hypothetical protein
VRAECRDVELGDHNRAGANDRRPATPIASSGRIFARSSNRTRPAVRRPGCYERQQPDHRDASAAAAMGDRTMDGMNESR